MVPPVRAITVDTVGKKARAVKVARGRYMVRE